MAPSVGLDTDPASAGRERPDVFRTGAPFAERFWTLFSGYLLGPREEILAQVQEMGRDLISSDVPPEEIAEIFGEALRRLFRERPDLDVGSTLSLVPALLVEMFMVYGMAFRQGTALRRDCEAMRLAAHSLDASSEGIWISDEKGVVLAVNRSFCTITGYAADEVVGGTFPLCHAVAGDGTEIAAIWEAARADGQWKGETRNRRKNGEIYPARVRLTMTNDPFAGTCRYVGFLDDITEDRRFQEGRMHLGTAMENVAESIVITNPGGVIQYANPATEKMSGYSRSELIGRNFQVFAQRMQSPGSCEAMWATVKKGDIWSGESIYQRKDGSFYSVVLSTSPIKDPSGSIVDFVSVLRDNTREIQLEVQLLHASKMEAVATLAGGIAHDFNNILTAVMGYTELALHKLEMGDAITRELDLVLAGGLRARDLVRRILTFSRHTEMERKPVTIGPILKETVKLLQALLPGSIRIHYSICDGDALALVDPTQMHQLMMNLCTNAAHAMKEKGGCLEIGLSEVDMGPDDPRRGQGMPPGPYLELSVSDTGGGILPENVPRIFDPFFTTKGPHEGTGLGLSVVHGIVKRHDGWIDVESELGRGTVFRAYLPRHLTAPPLRSAEDTGIPGGDARILLVDDEEVLVHLWEQQLTRLGYDVVARTGSAEALETFRADPEAFDAVMTDYTMPGMNGIDLKCAMKSIRPDIPVILCTGYSGLMSPGELEDNGFSGLLEKPLLLHQVAELLHRVLAGKGSGPIGPNGSPFCPDRVKEPRT